MSLLNTIVPQFAVKAYHAGAFEDVNEKKLDGHWSVLFFYPADFSAVCPTELYDLQEHYAEFAKMGVEVYSVSTDSHYSHQGWAESTPMIDQIAYPMLADHAQALCVALGVLIAGAGVAERATFILDPERRIKAIEISDGPVARKADELVRKVKAAQFVAATGKIAPATWAVPQAQA
ncbi:MAG: redoxin domain-containing protein [Bifidobacteriaceae bacterium]|jgi:peroxiredoxin (alkyl hydroperoxide reductase subunit C)|nr:redoxin domain-containing protein [Bifidobacteriaceae bacterium]